MGKYWGNRKFSTWREIYTIDVVKIEKVDTKVESSKETDL